jgi:hypothetical protein
VSRIAEEAARARIHRRHQHDAGGKSKRSFHARDGDFQILERLAQHLQHVFAKFGQFVEEEHTMMGQADLARPRQRAAANQPGVGNRMMR